jgi:general secretion pathway protein L
MSETLLIRLNSAADVRDWAIADEQGGLVGNVGTGDLPDTQNRRVTVLVPGDDVVLAHAHVPGKNRQRVLQAVPYALEEQFAEDIENLHFAVGAQADAAGYPVAVVSKARMDLWVARLKAMNVAPDAMYSEVQVLPFHDDSWSLLVDGDRALVRNGLYSGFASDLTMVDTLFGLYAGRESAPQRVQVYGDTVVDLGVIDAYIVEESRPPLGWMADGHARAAGVDLLQGPYSFREDFRALLRPWRATAALLAICCLFALGAVGVENFRLAQQSEALSANIEQLFKRTLPETKRIVNPRAQMEQALRRLERQTGAAGTEFLALLGEAGAVLRRTGGVEINGASFRDGRLDLELAADNLQILDELKQALAGSGRLKAEIQSATTESGQKVKSRLRVEGVSS